MMPALPELRHRFFIRQVVGQSERIDTRRHAILRGLVAEFDDFLDHLALGLMERSLFFADLDQGFEFLVAKPHSFSEMLRCQSIDDRGAGAFDQAADAIKLRYGGFE